MDKIARLKHYIAKSNYIVFFGGAGVSTESNIPDFRGKEGIYKTITQYGVSPEVMLSHTYFMEHTSDFFAYYKTSLVHPNAQPNPAHYALSALEKQGKLKAIITQNVDGLHQASGAKNVYELHGSIARNYCMDCHSFYSLDYLLKTTSTPRCSRCGGIVKPDVVLYEESLDQETLQAAIRHIHKADLLIIGGTSLNVYPAASLIQYFRGSHLVIINKEITPYDQKADLVIQDAIGVVLSKAILDANKED